MGYQALVIPYVLFTCKLPNVVCWFVNILWKHSNTPAFNHSTRSQGGLYSIVLIALFDDNHTSLISLIYFVNNNTKVFTVLIQPKCFILVANRSNLQYHLNDLSLCYGYSKCLFCSIFIKIRMMSLNYSIKAHPIMK